MWRKQETSRAAAPAAPVAPAPSTETPAARVIEETAPAVEAAPPENNPAMAMDSFLAPSEEETRGMIIKSLRIRGEVTGHGDLIIDGEVHGKVRITEGKVTVGENGRVDADIEAREIEVLGRVQGLLRGAERVLLGRTAVASGDIAAPRVVIEDGARFTGRVEVLRREEAPAAKAASAGAAAVHEGVTPLAVASGKS